MSGSDYQNGIITAGRAMLDDLHHHKALAKRLRAQFDEARRENERLRYGIEFLRKTITDAADHTESNALAANFRNIAKELTDLLERGTE